MCVFITAGPIIKDMCDPLRFPHPSFPLPVSLPSYFHRTLLSGNIVWMCAVFLIPRSVFLSLCHPISIEYMNTASLSVSLDKPAFISFFSSFFFFFSQLLHTSSFALSPTLFRLVLEHTSLRIHQNLPRRQTRASLGREELGLSRGRPEDGRLAWESLFMV